MGKGENLGSVILTEALLPRKAFLLYLSERLLLCPLNSFISKVLDSTI